MNTDGHGSRRKTRQAAWSAIAAAAIALGWGGCSLPEAQPDPTRYYVLTASATTDDAPRAEASEERSVWVRAVFVPEYLRGRIMPVRMAANEVKFIDQARWAEPLDAGITRVLRENIERAGEGLRVVGRGGEAHDYDVAVHLRSCEGVLPDGVARLAARFELFSAADGKLLLDEDFAIEVAGWDGRDYGLLAAKLSEAAAALGDRMAERVLAQQR